MAKLTEEDVAAIRVARGTNVALGRQFGVSETMIRYIRKGQNWRVIEDGRVKGSAEGVAA